jgi:hypothetical protein
MRSRDDLVGRPAEADSLCLIGLLAALGNVQECSQISSAIGTLGSGRIIAYELANQ